MTKVVIPGVVIAFLIFYVMTSPDQAANVFHAGWHAIDNVAHGISHFINKLAS